MKTLFIVFLSLPLFITAQSNFKESVDTIRHRKMLIGEGRSSALKTDTNFSWFNKNYAEYEPDKEAISTIKKHGKGVSFIVFAGTWCGDTKRELPRFYKVMDAVGMPESNINLYMVDRTKKSADGLTKKYKIKSVPTIILLRDGHEIKRIVEKPRKSIEKDLARKLKKWLSVSITTSNQ